MDPNAAVQQGMLRIRLLLCVCSTGRVDLTSFVMRVDFFITDEHYCLSLGWVDATSCFNVVEGRKYLCCHICL